MSANQTQVGGDHYAGTYQHWDFVADVLCGAYFEGQITKYLCRWRKKNGVQDLQKVAHFLDKLIELFKQGRENSMGRSANAAADARKFCFSQNLGHPETVMITNLAVWETLDDLLLVKLQLEDFIKENS